MKPPSSTSLPRTDRKKTVLVVDDDPVLLRAVSLVLSRVGYETISAGSGVAALAHLEADPELIDLVLSDLNMPDLSGIDLARLARRVRPGLPVVLCTGARSTPHDDARAWRTKVLQKPFSTSELQEALLLAFDAVVANDSRDDTNE